MAIYHLSVKTISRSQGRSATAAAAYRTAAEIVDERTGEIHDYRRKSGVEHTEIVLPENAHEWAKDRAKLWNAAEQSETRKNSTVAREFEISLPTELSKEDRQKLAVDFAREIVERHGVAADIAIHEPSKGGDNRNHHAHILITTRELTADGFTRKTRELDDRKSGEIDRWRERFAELQNASFKQSGIDETVDHRSLKDQGIDREPTQHLGVTATSYERRTGEPSRRREDAETYAAERLKDTKEMQELEQEIRDLECSIIATSTDLDTARKARERNARIKAEAEQTMRAIFEKRRQRNEQQPAPAKTEQAQVNPAEILKPAPTKETAEQQERQAMLKLGEINTQLRETWRKSEHEKLLKEVDIKRLDAWKLKEKEPVKSFFGGEKYKREFAEWQRNLQRIIDEHSELKKKAEDALKGGSFNERAQYDQFERQTRETLKKRHPELDQALTNKAEREQQAREEQQRERLREQERQKQERKQNPRKDHDLER